MGLALFLMDGQISATPTHQFHGVFLNGPTFLKSMDAQYMGELFIKVIEDVGVDSCMQIITDNAPVCKAVGMIIEAKYP